MSKALLAFAFFVFGIFLMCVITFVVKSTLGA
jgi:hypothetical protein